MAVLASDALLGRAIAASAQWRPSTTVTGLARSGEGWQVAFKDGRGIEADRVIVTVPLGVLKADTIVFDPPLPEALEGRRG